MRVTVESKVVISGMMEYDIRDQTERKGNKTVKKDE